MVWPSGKLELQYEEPSRAGIDGLVSVFKSGSERFHSATIHAQIRITTARRRPKVNDPLILVEQELHIIDKMKNAAGKLYMQISIGGRDNLCTRLLFDDHLQSGKGLDGRSGKANRTAGMLRTGRVSGDAIGFCGTWEKLSLDEPQIRWSLCTGT